MTSRPIMDADPGLNFFSLNKERLLFSALGPLSVPEAVKEEILRKAQKDSRFAASELVWRKLPERLMKVLSDDPTDDLAATVLRITKTPIQKRVRTPKDLGETMAIAHAAVLADQGTDVIVLMDDSGGRSLVAQEQRRLKRRRAAGQTAGQLHLISTITVLERAAGGQHLPTRSALRDLYARLRTLDDALIPLDRTNLLRLECWQRPRQT